MEGTKEIRTIDQRCVELLSTLSETWTDFADRERAGPVEVADPAGYARAAHAVAFKAFRDLVLDLLIPPDRRCDCDRCGLPMARLVGGWRCLGCGRQIAEALGTDSAQAAAAELITAAKLARPALDPEHDFHDYVPPRVLGRLSAAITGLERVLE